MAPPPPRLGKSSRSLCVSFRSLKEGVVDSFWAQDFNHMDQLSKDGSGFVKAGYKGIQLPTHFSPCAPTTSDHSELPAETRA